jgi:hypothetical protein
VSIVTTSTTTKMHACLSMFEYIFVRERCMYMFGQLRKVFVALNERAMCMWILMSKEDVCMF